MSPATRLLCCLSLCVAPVCVRAADLPKESPFTQAGTPASTATASEMIEFAGVTTMGKDTMINLYDKQEKQSFWLKVGETKNGLTVTKYDGAHDQVTIRRGVTEKVLPLRAEAAVKQGSATPAPVAAVSTPVLSPGTSAPVTPTSSTSLSQARQEEEARMLVSDLLEIGMAQRRAYEDAQKRAASGQPTQAQPQDPNAAPPAAVPPGASSAAPAQPAPTPTPSA